MRSVAAAGLWSCAFAALGACASADGARDTGVDNPGAGDAGWQTVWFDDFDGDSLDRTLWTPEESCWGGGNNERQCYTDRPANIQVEDSILHLIAREETFTGPLRADSDESGQATQAYTSGKIRTRGLADWTYGRFSARMKLPEGQGTWPAFWMMPSDSVYGRWPLSGEIDIMEAVNLGTPCEDCPQGVETRSSGAAHFGDLAPENTYLYLKTPGERAQSPADEWRVYTLEWGEGRLQWFVDGELFMRLTSEDWHTASPAAEGRPHAPFDQPFYLMLNLAAGGNLPEKSNDGGFDPASFPAELLVDWVRVEQCAGDEETGLACLDDQAWTGTPMGPWEVQAQ